MEISKALVGGMLLLTSVAWAEVKTEALPEMKVGTIGVETGFGPRIWGDKPDADNILKQIAEAGEAPLNDSEKEILKKVLMTDVGGVVALEERGEAYLVARVEALMAQGLFEEALTLLSKVPERQLSNSLKQLTAKVLFVSGRVEKACTELFLESFDTEEAFIRAVCADVTGVPPQSALAYEVYRESGKDNHPFLNAAGEVLYRGLDISLPKGEPSVWEIPVVARVWGEDIFKLNPTKTQKWVLVNQDRIPDSVRETAERTLMDTKPFSADGQVLMHLTQMAEHRRQVEKVLKDKYAN